MEVWIIIGAVALIWVYALRRSKQKNADRLTELQHLSEQMQREQERPDSHDPEIDVEGIPPRGGAEEQVVEIITSNGEPAFKYRFHANLDFNTPSDVLRKHRMEEFIERPGGNRDAIQEEYGWWALVSRWDRAEWAYDGEAEKFKYVGGPMAYIEFLLTVRSAYEDANRTPQSKRDGIRKACEDNKRMYAVQHFYQPPWETLIVPVLSLAEGFGPHKVGLMDIAGIRSIHDIESRSDKELADVKGIGKASVAALRNLAGSWPHDKFTDCIEKDEQYRRPAK